MAENLNIVALNQTMTCRHHVGCMLCSFFALWDVLPRCLIAFLIWTGLALPQPEGRIGRRGVERRETVNPTPLSGERKSDYIVRSIVGRSRYSGGLDDERCGRYGYSRGRVPLYRLPSENLTAHSITYLHVT